MDIWTRLSSADVSRLKNSAKVAQKIETTWDREVSRAFNKHMDEVAKAIVEGRTKMPEFDLTDLLIEHSFKVQEAAILYAMKETEIEKGINSSRLASPVIPKALRDLRKLYDKWKRGEYRPKRPTDQGKRIEKAYLEKIHQTWTELSEDFRQGKEFTQEEVREKIKEKAGVGESRAHTIIRTETTNFYNKARKDYYDQSEDVTHYLFMAVRDSATTPWCTPKTINGKRGRHGLVYAKDDPITEVERPSCHWNCRSEFLPLSPHTPSHRRLIEDKSIQRRNVKCTPLPKGWVSRG